MRLTMGRNSDRKRVWGWLTRIGVGRSYPGTPIGWYQIHQNAAETIIDRLAASNGCPETYEVRCDRLTVQARSERGSWVTLGSVSELFKAADRITRNGE